MLSRDRLKVLERIKEYEKKGEFNLDVEDDPELIKLEPKDVDYVREKISSKIKTFIANKMAINYYEKKIANKEFEIEKIIGLENFNLVKDKGVIITCNHFSPNDNYAVYRALKSEFKKGQYLYKVIKEGNFTAHKGILGFFFRNCNTLPLSSNVATMIKFLKSVELLLKNGEKILIYPEQSMWWNYIKPRPLKIGAFNIASKFKVPILPIFITMKDGDKILSDGSLSQKYTVNIGAPIFTDDALSEKENVKIIMEKNFEFCKNTYQDFYKKELCYGEE